MILIVTNSGDVTADYLAGRLARAGVGYARFDTDRFVEAGGVRCDGSGPQLKIGPSWLSPEQARTVWYRRPERLRLPGGGDDPESGFIADEWSEAVEGWFAHVDESRWVNHPAAEAAACHKLEQLSRARRLGFAVPDTLVTQDPVEFRAFHAKHAGRLIVKPMARGHIERPAPAADTVIFTSRVRPEHLERAEDLFGCPTLFQEEVRKRSDVRITVVGDDIHAVGLTAADEDGAQRCDIRRNHMGDVAHEPVPLPADVAAAVRALVRSYRLRFAAVDMAVDASGSWVFFEVNPNGQWAWMDLNGSADIAASFVKMFGG